jgi:hypothetical protein
MFGYLVIDNTDFKNIEVCLSFLLPLNLPLKGDRDKKDSNTGNGLLVE